MHPNVNLYFQTARERYKIRMLKEDMRQKAPWSKDPVFQDWRFCNVHREDDKTTVWFRKKIREPLMQRHLSHQIMATIIFRWFNRIETGEIIKDLILDEQAYRVFNVDEARRRLKDVRPIVTGAYIIKCGDGVSKLEGILAAIQGAYDYMHKVTPHEPDFATLEAAWKYLQGIPWMGPFMAYEVVSDLRWTPVLNGSPDILLWANPGPGCARGISRAFGHDVRHFRRGNTDHRRQMLALMQWLLGMARDKKAGYWPAEWREWEMREVEHWACEFDKWSRVMAGDRMKQTYPGR